MNNIQSVKSIRNSRSFLLNALLIAFLFILNVSAFGNGVTNAGNTNARITDARERGICIVTKSGNTITSRVKTSDYVLEIEQIGDKASNGVYEAKITIKDLNGNVVVTKSGNEGVSTLFPDNWAKVKIKDEVEYAITNNHGKFDPTKPNSNEYFGLSRDGKVEIHFYIGSDGSITSYFPVK